MLNGELWADIPDYEGLYQVSNKGRVKSIERQITQKGHKCIFTRTMPERILKPELQNSGYMMIQLCKHGIKKAFTIHRLVAIAFIDNVRKLPKVNHKDGNKTNNSVENLEWVTGSENIYHSHCQSKRKSTGKAIMCIDTNTIYSSAAEAANLTGINVGGIKHAANGKAKTAGGYKWKRI